MKSLPSLLYVSVLLIQLGVPGLLSAEEPASFEPHCHILFPGADRFDDVFFDDRGNPLDTKEKCRKFRQGKGAAWKGFFKAHWEHCTVAGKDERAIGDKFQCAAAGGVMNDRTHIVRTDR